MRQIVFSYRDTPLPLAEEDAELLRDHLPSGWPLRVELELCLEGLPEGPNAMSIGPVIHTSEYREVLEAIRAGRRSDVEISDGLARLEDQLGSELEQT